ncbi:MAG: SH3-like domain-containing protein [Acidobacteria bacterium]|nr:SH3-like domain-containing protein [Acidobacteriota bacterium]
MFSNEGRTLLGVFLLLTGLLAGACSKTASLNETAYVLPEKLRLKNSTAQAARPSGELKGGDKVTIIARSKTEDGTPWVHVNGPGGQQGWAETRYFVKEEIVTESRKIADQIKDIPTQALGKSKATLKLRLTPDRQNDDNVATLLPSGTEMEIVARERKPRPASLDQKADNAEGASVDSKSGTSKSDVKYDEWLQVRLKDDSVLAAGWIYGGSVELDIPPEIIYFVSTGKRIVGWQKLGTVHGDDNRTGDHFLVEERKVLNADDRADFDRIKVLAYDSATRNYTTPFKDDLLGQFPVTLKMDGQSGTIHLTATDKNDQKHEVEYSVELLGGRVKVQKLISPGSGKK